MTPSYIYVLLSLLIRRLNQGGKETQCDSSPNYNLKYSYLRRTFTGRSFGGCQFCVCVCVCVCFVLVVTIKCFQTSGARSERFKRWGPKECTNGKSLRQTTSKKTLKKPDDEKLIRTTCGKLAAQLLFHWRITSNATLLLVIHSLTRSHPLRLD